MANKAISFVPGDGAVRSGDMSSGLHVLDGDRELVDNEKTHESTKRLMSEDHHYDTQRAQRTLI